MAGAERLINIVRSFEDPARVARKDIIRATEVYGRYRDMPLVNNIIKNATRVRHGVYDITLTPLYKRYGSNVLTMESSPQQDQELPVENEDLSYIPYRDKNFVGWGTFEKIESIIASKQFLPAYISGESGNGKTLFVEQACAKLKRPYVRVQISPETDESDLIGGFRLEDGNTVFSKGPVVRALEAGAVLLIDEIDRGTNKIMCLQGIMEGKPFLIKKTGEIIRPAEGFNVIATGNTLGRGSNDGRFIAASILDEAFLERFPIMLRQPYPTVTVEKRILEKLLKNLGKEPNEGFVSHLVRWADIVRNTYDAGGIDDTISTRRLCQIIRVYAILGESERGSIELCSNRFEDETREALLELYDKICPEESNSDTGDDTVDKGIPF